MRDNWKISYLKNTLAMPIQKGNENFVKDKAIKTLRLKIDWVDARKESSLSSIPALQTEHQHLQMLHNAN